MKAKKILAGSAVLVAGALALSACSGSSGDSGDSGGNVEMTFWNNASTGPGKTYWNDTIKDFEDANPGVTIKVQFIQNEDMDGKLQTALNSGAAPDIFMARGGGKLGDVVKAGQVQDLTDKITDETKAALGDAVFKAFTVDDKIYGMPVSVLPGGLFYSADMFKAAGITDTPTTMDELNADIAKLKANGSTAVAVGAKDAWPAAHWYYFFALRECSEDVMNQAASSRTFSDSCWLKAGQDLADFAATKPFNEGFLTTSAQQGAGSSAGMLANHKAAMELMGAWEPGVVQSLTPDEKALADLSWFPFPSIDGGQGDPSAMMGGVDGFSCSINAPKQCADFLNFIVQKKYQEGYATAYGTLPASKDATDVVTDPSLKSVLKAYDDASYVMLWLDTMYGSNVGNALNVAVVNMLAGKGDAQAIVDAVNSAAAKS
ncbi:extracellular solute-binding protein [Microbacterium sp. KR10-403]|uniref:ABC transporter substrate-binding protein n=1 Tax=Microbacterium sp. KR10-403 TaxID=3158581 RepID=UPI0032E44A2E